ncbi:hypothetical protein [Silvimonas sp.]|uniref:hypothetical protein n=1 Tax=Silvimonas sp. TaxID=2650811 RepID=UPI00284499EC|nr:hypothetical protein [Silvimonas sp.]MDR3429700.1 hypothetical protein [Silvimonas sp.]
MEHRYISEERPGFDATVDAVIKAAEDYWGSGAMPMRVGIYGPSGEIYREIRAWGMGEYNRLTKRLIEAGFTGSGKAGKYDDLFQHAPQ